MSEERTLELETPTSILGEKLNSQPVCEDKSKMLYDSLVDPEEDSRRQVNISAKPKNLSDG